MSTEYKPYGLLGDPYTISSPQPRRAFSLPAAMRYLSRSSNIILSPTSSTSSLPLSSSYGRMSPPPSTVSSPGRAAKRLSYTIRNRISHHRIKAIITSFLLIGIFLFYAASTPSTSSVARRHRLQPRYQQTVFSSKKPKSKGYKATKGGKSNSETNGLSYLDDDENSEWLSEDDLFFAAYTEEVPLTPEQLKAEEANEMRKNDVIEKNRQQSLRALTWFLAEGGEFPDDWNVPTKAYLRKVGGRGMERMLMELEVELGEEEELAKGKGKVGGVGGGIGAAVAKKKITKQEVEEEEEESIFEDGWEEYAKSRYRVVVFSKTYCPYSRKAKEILDKYRLSPAPFIIELDTRSDTVQIQDLLNHLTGRRTVPNILLDFKSIGGSDDLTLIHAEGGLQRKFEEMEVLPGHRRFNPQMNRPQAINAPHQVVAPPPAAPVANKANVIPGAEPVRGAQNPGAGAGVGHQVDQGIIRPDSLGYTSPENNKIKNEKAFNGIEEDEEFEDDEEVMNEVYGQDSYDDEAYEEDEEDDIPEILQPGANAADIRKAVQAAHGIDYLYDESDYPEVHAEKAARLRQQEEEEEAEDEEFLNDDEWDEEDEEEGFENSDDIAFQGFGAPQPPAPKPHVAAPAAAKNVNPALPKVQARHDDGLPVNARFGKGQKETQEKIKQNQVKIRKGQKPWDEVEHVKTPEKDELKGINQPNNIIYPKAKNANGNGNGNNGMIIQNNPKGDIAIPQPGIKVHAENPAAVAKGKAQAPIKPAAAAAAPPAKPAAVVPDAEDEEEDEDEEDWEDDEEIPQALKRPAAKPVVPPPAPAKAPIEKNVKAGVNNAKKPAVAGAGAGGKNGNKKVRPQAAADKVIPGKEINKAVVANQQQEAAKGKIVNPKGQAGPVKAPIPNQPPVDAVKVDQKPKAAEVEKEGKKAPTIAEIKARVAANKARAKAQAAKKLNSNARNAKKPGRPGAGGAGAGRVGAGAGAGAAARNVAKAAGGGVAGQAVKKAANDIGQAVKKGANEAGQAVKKAVNENVQNVKKAGVGAGAAGAKRKGMAKKAGADKRKGKVI